VQGAKKIFPGVILGTRAIGSVVLLWSLPALIAEMKDQKDGWQQCGFYYTKIPLWPVRRRGA